MEFTVYTISIKYKVTQMIHKPIKSTTEEYPPNQIQEKTKKTSIPNLSRTRLKIYLLKNDWRFLNEFKS